MEEQAGVPHHFIDSHNLKDELTAGQYALQAEKTLEEIFERKDVAIIAGGSGMFIDALCTGLDEIPSSDEVNLKYTQLFLRDGLQELQKRLLEKDPEYFEQIDIHNPVRIIRALEAMEISGEKMSEMRKGFKKDKSFQVLYFVLDHDRSVLYERINRRVDEMIDAGLEAEARSVFELRELRSLQTVGYAEFFDYFDGKQSYEETIEKIKQNTRRYAKRQLTWFRRYKEALWLNLSEDTSRTIAEIYRNK